MLAYAPRMARKILIVEDDELFQKMTAQVLEGVGYEVVIAEDGPTGLALAAKDMFDLILVDLMIPGMHGFEVIQQLRRNLATLRTPIIVHSAKVYESDQRRAISLGAQTFLQKPVAPEQLLAAVSRELDCVRVGFWGVRGSIAAPGPETVRYGGNTPCVTIQSGSETLILDAGTGIRRLGLILQAEGRGQPLDLNLLVTHTHWDHIQGFPFFVPAYVPGNTVNVWGPRSLSKPLDKVLRGQMDPEYFPVALGDMASNINATDVRGPVDVGSFHVTSAFMNHPGVTLGYRIEVNGLTIVYATDTEPFERLFKHTLPNGDPEEVGHRLDRTLVDLAADADLYIGDAQYTSEDYAEKVGWGHSACTDAVEVALRANAKRFVLFSHDPMQNDDAVDAKLEQCRALALSRGSGLEVLAAAEGRSIVLPQVVD